MDVDLRNSQGMTALSIACFSGHLPIIKILVEEFNANINVPYPLNVQPKLMEMLVTINGS